MCSSDLEISVTFVCGGRNEIAKNSFLCVIGKPAAILQAPLLKEIFQVRATELFDPADGARILRFGALAQGSISE